jgi:anti-sigma B factor antagonist
MPVVNEIVLGYYGHVLSDGRPHMRESRGLTIHAMQLKLSHRVTPQGAVVISAAGKVRLGEECARINRLVDELLDRGRRDFIIDLSDVLHMDSTGIGQFISTLTRVQQAGGRLRMAAAKPNVREAFRITRLDTIFRFCDDVESACEDLR